MYHVMTQCCIYTINYTVQAALQSVYSKRYHLLCAIIWTYKFLRQASEA